MSQAAQARAMNSVSISTATVPDEEAERGQGRVALN